MRVEGGGVRGRGSFKEDEAGGEEGGDEWGMGKGKGNGGTYFVRSF